MRRGRICYTREDYNRPYNKMKESVRWHIAYEPIKGHSFLLWICRLQRRKMFQNQMVNDRNRPIV